MDEQDAQTLQAFLELLQVSEEHVILMLDRFRRMRRPLADELDN